MKDSGYEQLVTNIRTEADNLKAHQDASPQQVRALRQFADFIAMGRWGNNNRETEVKNC
jgi:hypothetical protein